MKATVFGDSILKGVLLENGRYTVNHEWEERLSREFRCEVRNRSRFGCTIRKAMPAITRDCAEKTEEGEYVLLEFGGNDCDYPWTAISEEPDGFYVCKTPPDVFTALYAEAVERIKKSGRIPVLLSLPPIHSERYLHFVCRNGLSERNILHWLGDVDAIYRWQAHYSAIIQNIAEKTRTAWIDLRKAFPSMQQDLVKFLCEDGIHPSRSGQELIYQTFRNVISGSQLLTE